MAIQEKSQAAGSSNVQVVNKLLLDLKPFVEELERLVEIEQKFIALLYEPEFLFKFRKKWIAFAIAVRIYNEIMSKGKITPSIKYRIQQIKPYDDELSEMISGIVTFLESVSLGGIEAEYLMKYEIDTDSWVDYSFTKGIQPVITRIKMFLMGGIEDGTRFVGLYKDFKDVQLTRRILKDDSIRQLWRYNEQVQYLQSLIDMCMKAEGSGEWEGFYGKNGFWTNFNTHADKFATRFGNTGFASYLMEQKGKVGENPEAWGGIWKITSEGNEQRRILIKDGILPQQMRKLQHPTYQRKKIVLPAAEKINALLKGREKEIEFEKESLLKKKFSQLIKGRMRKLIRELRKDTEDASAIVMQPMQRYADFLKEHDSGMHKITVQYLREVTNRLLHNSQLHQRYYSQKLQGWSFMLNLVEAVKTSTAGKFADSGIRLIRYYESFQHLDEGDLNRIRGLIQKAMDLIKEFKKINEHIGTVMDKYTIPFDKIGAANINPFSIKNINLDLGYVERRLERVLP